MSVLVFYKMVNDQVNLQVDQNVIMRNIVNANSVTIRFVLFKVIT